MVKHSTRYEYFKIIGAVCTNSRPIRSFLSTLNILSNLPVPYSSSNRRSTDSYDDEYYECYERPRRRRQGGWTGSHGSSGGGGGNQVAGGHSSSSRDVSPWEEEQPKRREVRESRSAERVGWSRNSKQQFDRYRERRPTDSWDEEDEYEYVIY